MTLPEDLHGDDGTTDNFVDETTTYQELQSRLPLMAKWAYDYLTGNPKALDHPADNQGWTWIDYRALAAVHEVDLIDRLAGPATATPLDTRLLTRVEHMSALREALPFSEAERRWLFSAPDHHLLTTRGLLLNPLDDPPYIESVRQSEARLMSNGIWRVVRGRDLMQRWWSWRHETGEYAGEPSGLQQARESLHGLVQLLDPKRGGGEAETS